MLIIKVKHESGIETEFIDILIEGKRKQDIIFILFMLERNDKVTSYNILNSTMTTFDLIDDLKSNFGFSGAQFPKFKC